MPFVVPFVSLCNWSIAGDRCDGGCGGGGRFEMPLVDVPLVRVECFDRGGGGGGGAWYFTGAGDDIVVDGGVVVRVMPNS